MLVVCASSYGLDVAPLPSARRKRRLKRARLVSRRVCVGRLAILLRVASLIHLAMFAMALVLRDVGYHRSPLLAPHRVARGSPGCERRRRLRFWRSTSRRRGCGRSSSRRAGLPGTRGERALGAGRRGWLGRAQRCQGLALSWRQAEAAVVEVGSGSTREEWRLLLKGILCMRHSSGGSAELESRTDRISSNSLIRGAGVDTCVANHPPGGGRSAGAGASHSYHLSCDRVETPPWSLGSAWRSERIARGRLGVTFGGLLAWIRRMHCHVRVRQALVAIIKFGGVLARA